MIDLDINKWNEHGFLILEKILNAEELELMLTTMNEFLFGDLSDTSFRSDLSGKNQETGKESITQIMRPSLQWPYIGEWEIYSKFLDIAKNLIGNDVRLDFDMMINKLPNSNTETPWHQDAA